MWWRNNKKRAMRGNERRFLATFHPLAAACFLLAACGFQPMYGQQAVSPVSSSSLPLENIAIAATSVDPANKRLAQQFHISLEDRLNPRGGGAGAAQFRLNATINMLESPIAISPDGTVSRYNVTLEAYLRLERLRDGKLVYSGTARRTASYSTVSNAFYSTYVSSQDAIGRAVMELAEDVRLRMATFFTQNPNVQTLAPVLPLPPVSPPVYQGIEDQ